MLTPVWEKDASGSVQLDYSHLKTALNLPSVPLFFAYMGNFPEYLNYITEQIVKNIEDKQFTELTDDLADTIRDLMKGSLTKPEPMTTWLGKYDNTPSFYNFQKDTEKIFMVNLKLVCIFIALREAVKGWAIAAKQLPHMNPTGNTEKTVEKEIKEDLFIYENILTTNVDTASQSQETYSIDKQMKALSTTPSQALERDLLPQYLRLSRESFAKLLKEEQTLYLRVGLERLILSSLQLFPHLIFSPINVVLKLTSSYDNFYELVYLLSEHFPTYAVQRLMFSGFMLK